MHEGARLGFGSCGETYPIGFAGVIGLRTAYVTVTLEARAALHDVAVHAH